MTYSKNAWEGVSEDYRRARISVEILCGKIVMGIIPAEEAFREYEQVAAGFCKACPEKAELFNMIYASRIKRLLSQFPVRRS